MNKKTINNAFFWIAISLILIKLLIVLFYFNFTLTDNDQAAFWWACHDLSKGVLHTPLTYGNAYGSFLESILAIPFYKLGLPLYYALPFSNMIWIFLFILSYSLQLRKINQGYLTILIPICFLFLSHEYLAVLLASKALMAGMFMVFVAFLTMPKKSNIWKESISAIILGLAIGFNPNSFFLVLLFFINLKEKKQILRIGVISVTTFFIYSISLMPFKEFLDTGLIHKQWEINFVPSSFFSQLTYVDKYLNLVTPIFYKMGFISIVLPILYLILIWKNSNRWKKVFLFLYFSLLVLSFGLNKVMDGDSDLLFPYARFYLAIGFVNVFILSGIFESLFVKWPRAFYPSIILAFGLIVFNMSHLKERTIYEAEQAGKNTCAVVKTKIIDLKKDAKCIKEIMNLHPDYSICTVGHMLYSTGFFLRTEDIDFELITKDVEKYYWLNNMMKDTVLKKNVIFIPRFNKYLEQAKKQKYREFRTHKGMDYFLEKEVTNWYVKRDEYFKD